MTEKKAFTSQPGVNTGSLKFHLICPSLITIEEIIDDEIEQSVCLERDEAEQLRDWLNKVLS